MPTSSAGRAARQRGGHVPGVALGERPPRPDRAPRAARARARSSPARISSPSPASAATKRPSRAIAGRPTVSPSPAERAAGAGAGCAGEEEDRDQQGDLREQQPPVRTCRPARARCPPGTRRWRGRWRRAASITARARREKARTASTAKGRASAPSARAAARSSARERQERAEPRARRRGWSASSSAAGRPDAFHRGGVPGPRHGRGADGRRAAQRLGARRPAGRRRSSSRSRSRSSAARSSSTPWRTSHTVPNWLWPSRRAHSPISSAAPARPVTTVDLIGERGEPGEQHEPRRARGPSGACAPPTRARWPVAASRQQRGGDQAHEPERRRPGAASAPRRRARSSGVARRARPAGEPHHDDHDQHAGGEREEAGEQAHQQRAHRSRARSGPPWSAHAVAARRSAGGVHGRPHYNESVRAVIFDAGNTLLRMNYAIIAEQLEARGRAGEPRTRWRRPSCGRGCGSTRTSRRAARPRARSTHGRYLRYLLEHLAVTEEAEIEAIARWRRGYNLPGGALEPGRSRGARGGASGAGGGPRGGRDLELERLGAGASWRRPGSPRISTSSSTPRSWAWRSRIRASSSWACAQAGVAAAEAVYVGDLYSVDVLGARAAGLDASCSTRAASGAPRDCRVARGPRGRRVALLLGPSRLPATPARVTKG